MNDGGFLLVSGLYVFVIVFVMGCMLPHTLSIFRLKRMFNNALIICSVLLIVGIVFQFQDGFDCLERRALFYPLYGIVFLLLYKFADNFALKKLGRNMYYFYLFRYANDKSRESTVSENIGQSIILILTFVVPYYISYFLVKIWYSC